MKYVLKYSYNKCFSISSLIFHDTNSCKYFVVLTFVSFPNKINFTSQELNSQNQTRMGSMERSYTRFCSMDHAYAQRALLWSLVAWSALKRFFNMERSYTRLCIWITLYRECSLVDLVAWSAIYIKRVKGIKCCMR